MNVRPTENPPFILRDPTPEKQEQWRKHQKEIVDTAQEWYDKQYIFNETA